MGFGKRTVDFQRFQSGLFGPLIRLRRRRKTKNRKQNIAISQAIVSQGVPGIFGNCLLKVFGTFVQSETCLLPEIAPPQIVLIGFGVRGVASYQAPLFFVCQAQP